MDSSSWIATYRLQLHSKFTLIDAEKILPYLSKLGISHVYLSPCLQAAPNSQHGYDVTDPTHISDDLGGEDGWTRFTGVVKKLGLRLLLDIVPNHMSASEYNPWWDDVLEKGPASEYAQFFDIRLPDGGPFLVHLCTLGRSYGDALAAGDLKLHYTDGRLRLAHYDNTWPICASSVSTLEGLSSSRSTEDATAVLRDAQERGDLERILNEVNTNPSALDRLLQQQFYRLHGWQRAGEFTNYRRFFDVSGLVGMRTERDEVFNAVHARYERMIEQGEVDGLRVDHPDGLRHPGEYLQRLRGLLPAGRIYVEKILDSEEPLNRDWAIEGTVGYDFLAKVNRLWMSEQRIDVLTATYADFTGHSVNLAALIREKKDFIVGHLFASDHSRLTEAAVSIANASYSTSDLSPGQLRDALAQITAAMGVYRTYRTTEAVGAEDKRVLLEAIRSARIGRSDIDSETYDFFVQLLTKDNLNSDEAAFLAQWQQLTPAVMAKGVEDTTFYCFDRLLSCNEVGAQASLVGISSDKFHEYCHYLGEQWPYNLLATSTHDNKRSEDVRTRISILSEIPDQWGEVLQRWARMNEGAWNNRTPDRHAEYLLYQTLIGAWPISTDRCWQYMLKASREAKMRTSWHVPNVGYEENIKGFVERVLQSAEFVASLQEFVAPLEQPGRINSLAQTLIKMTAPGLPDFYQGTELWDLSLVDPDNRRPVEYLTREALLARGEEMNAAEVVEDWNFGLPKLWMIHRLLKYRREHAGEFAAESKYQPLVAQGSRLGHVLAYRRGDNLIAVVPRLATSIASDWGDTQLPLPGGTWRCLFNEREYSGRVAPGELFKPFPVSLLIRQ